MSVISVADFFTVEVWIPRMRDGLVRYHVYFVMDLAKRQVKIAHIGCQVNGQVMAQVARNLTDYEDGYCEEKGFSSVTTIHSILSNSNKIVYLSLIYPRIVGALQNLGVRRSKTTIANILQKEGIKPTPERHHLDWNGFLKSHWDVLSATDFFTTEVWIPRMRESGSLPRSFHYRCGYSKSTRYTHFLLVE